MEEWSADVQIQLEKKNNQRFVEENGEPTGLKNRIFKKTRQGSGKVLSWVGWEESQVTSCL